MKLVIADDEAFIRQAYQDGLTRAGFEVFVAVDGVEALKVIQEVVPDVVLLDLIMPRMDGFQVLKTVKADEKLNKIPIIVLSNLSQATDEKEIRKLGAADFLVKSDYALKQLIEKIRSMVGTSNPPA